MNHQNPLPGKMVIFFRILLRNVPQHMEGGSAGAYPLALRVRQDGIMNAVGKLPGGAAVLDFMPVNFRLCLVGSSQDYHVPFQEVFLSKAPLVIRPGVQAALLQKQGLKSSG